MAGFKVGFIMFRIIHCSSAFPGSMKKSDWVVRPKKANMENGEDGKAIIEWDGKEGRSGGAGRSIAGWRNGRRQGK